MKKSLATILFVCLLLPMGIIYRPGISDAGAGNSPGGLKIRPQTSKIQLPFIANEGQIDNRVRYYAQTFNGSFFITQNGELAYSIEKHQKADSRKESSERSVIREIFTGDIKSPSFKGEGESTKISIYKGNEPAKWKRNIPSYERVSMGDIYQGIELKLKAYGDTVEKIFSVKPGADPKAIRSRLEGAKDIQVNKKGELEVQTDIGTAVFSKPIAYQAKGQGENGKGQKEYVQVAYSVEGNQYGFIVGDYDKTRELVIDPYVGIKIQGSAEDRAYAIIPYFDGDVDRIFVAGYSYSSNFPVNQTIGTSGTSDSDVFVAKLSSYYDEYYGDIFTVDRIVFIAGTGDDFGYSLAMDSANNIYVAGTTTSSNLPIPATPFDDTYNGGTDVFVAKLSYDLSSLISLTYLGGSSLDAVNADSLAIDGINNSVVVAGYTTSTSFPTPDTYAYDTSYNGGEDVFIAIFNTGLEGSPTPNPGLEILKSTTFIGGSGNERPYAMALRTEYPPLTEIYLAGYTTSSSPIPFPTSAGAYNTTFNGGTEDAFISRIMPVMSPYPSPLGILASSTFLGGSVTGTVDEIHGLAISGSPDYYVYVTGNTNASDFPGSYISGSYGGMDVFVAQFGTFLTSSPTPVFAKLGGTSSDYGKSLILNMGVLYVSGVTYSADFPTTSGAFDTTFGGTHGTNSDGFIFSMYPPPVSLYASTYLGGSGDDFAPAIGASASGTGDIYVAGSTNSADFPTTLTSYGGSGSFEAYVAKLDYMLQGTLCIYTFNPENTTVPGAGGNFSFGITTSAGCTWGASTEDSWITTSSSGTDSGTVDYTVSSNPGPVRQGMIDVAGKIYTVTQNSSLTYNLNVFKIGTGTGTVTSTETPTPTINCGSTCSALYAVGTSVTLNAAASSDSVFAGWSGAGCSGTGPCTFAMNLSNTVIATFTRTKFTVTPVSGGHGNLNPSTQQIVNYNDTVSFSVKADDGYHIQSVSGCNGTAYTAANKKKKKKKNKPSAVSEMTYKTGHITENCTVTASFAINTFIVTPKAGEHGSIDPSTPQTVNYHDTASFMVKPDAGYQIKSVSGCGVHPSEGGTYITDPVTGDCTVEAAFAKEAFTVSILKSGTGSGAVTGNGITCEGNACGGTFEAGSKLTLKIKPDDGYRVIDVKINGKSIGPVLTITLKEILSNFAIEIVFGPV